MASAINSEPLGRGPTVNNAAGLKRPNGGKKWSEVCEQVQKPDGSVRTSPPFKGCTAPTNSPQRPWPASQNLDKLGRTALVERGTGGGASSTTSRGGSGSSRGRSSGKSSRSSSRDVARDGDISSRCSSSVWDTSTNSSEQMSRETDTPREDTVVDGSGVPSPLPSSSKALLMPDPIRPLVLLADEHGGHGISSIPEGHISEPKANEMCITNMQDGLCCEERDIGDVSPSPELQGEHSDGVPNGELAEGTDASGRAGTTNQMGLPLNLDPLGRDAPRRSEVKAKWTVEPLAKYLKGIYCQIDANIQNHRLPTAEKLDVFVSRLVANTQRHLRRAPKKTRQSLTSLCNRRFHRFWDFARNQKVRATTPEELKTTLMCLVEGIRSTLLCDSSRSDICN